MSRRQVVIATAASAIGHDPDLSLLVDAFTLRGIAAGVLPWQEIEPTPEQSVMIRSCWDYYREPGRFAAWCQALDECQNSANYVHWNMDKGYLLQLASRGIPVIPTALNEQSFSRLPIVPEYIVKPRISASGIGVRVLTRSQAVEASSALLSAGNLLQPRIRAQHGSPNEFSLILIDGKRSHAFLRAPILDAFDPLWRHPDADAGFSPAPEELSLPWAWAEETVRVAQCLVSAPDSPLYARVDFIGSEVGPLLLELELIEPALLLYRSQGSVDLLCDSFLRRTTGRLWAL